METMSIFAARSFWLAVGSVLAGITAAMGGETVIVPEEFAGVVYPLVTAALGVWAYAERFFGKKKLVLRSPN